MAKKQESLVCIEGYRMFYAVPQMHDTAQPQLPV